MQTLSRFVFEFPSLIVAVLSWLDRVKGCFILAVDSPHPPLRGTFSRGA